MATSRRKMAEDIDEFHRWLNQMLRDAKDKLKMSDGSIAYILFNEANRFYFLSISKGENKPDAT